MRTKIPRGRHILVGSSGAPIHGQRASAGALTAYLHYSLPSYEYRIYYFLLFKIQPKLRPILATNIIFHGIVRFSFRSANDRAFLSKILQFMCRLLCWEQELTKRVG